MENSLTYDQNSKTLAVRLEKVAVGEFVPYTELRALIGNPPGEKWRVPLAKARSVLQKEQRMVFHFRSGEGLVRLNDEEIVDTGNLAREKIRRTARRGARKVMCAEDANLSKEKITEKYAQAAVLGVLGHLSTDKGFNRVTAQYSDPSLISDYAKTAALLLTDK